MTSVLTITAVLSFYAFAYRAVVARWGTVVRFALRPFHLQTRRSVREVEAIGKLVAATAAQLLFALVLIILIQPPRNDLLHLNPTLLLPAAVLGVGELLLTSLLCTVVLAFAERERRTRRNADWAAQGRGGWMSYFLLTAHAAPRALAATNICLYIAIEELIFRGIVVSVLLRDGVAIAVAVVISTAIFVAVQSFSMPNWRGALFPLIGAAVIGTVHGTLYAEQRQLVPLIIAHSTFFIAALALARSRPAAAYPAH